MRFLALACDYDGTLAHDGRVDDVTLGALHRARDAGHTLLLVTGRELDDLAKIFPHLDLFARVVAENGALRRAIAQAELSPEDSRARIRSEVEARYTAPI